MPTPTCPERHIFDILIIGAGPAGTAAAITAARAGLSTAIIDKARFPRSKLCGGLISGRAATLYAQIFGGALDPNLFEPRTRISFHAGGAPLGSAVESPEMFLSMRCDLDAHLLSLAIAAGAVDLTGHRIEALELEGIPSARLADGRCVMGRILIGADGVNSMVARALYGRAYNPARVGFAMEVEAPPLPKAERGTIRIDLGAADWGYGWQFPKASSTTIGVGGIACANTDMRARLTDYRRVLDEQSAAPVKGHHLPFGEVRHVPGSGAILLVGDAAGLVDPITGEGIAHAMQSGAAAADAASAALARGNTAAALPAYRRALRPLHRSLRLARWLRPLLYGRRTRAPVLRAFAASSVLKAMYLDLLAGRAEYPALCRRALWRMPGALWRHRRGAETQAESGKTLAKRRKPG
ncbi:NAD(P)/FAD-dependent oxidoreductase [Roseovarius nanhaiticus]|uniref:NAD(P)/FAD-dependent oxidoreductase n=1 Tax=Roseovarius nanhaiticus TaxID=573024 RepID=UPI0024929490|nr:geranylgeranyl reductase family protein [Roseovarius nanhaiticus]